MATGEKETSAPNQEGSRTLKATEILLRSSVMAAIGTEPWAKFAGETDLSDLSQGLLKRMDAVTDGDLTGVERMLYGQAMTLQTIFTALSRRAANAEQLPQFQSAMSMAFKAQAQCRTTLEALAEIKNPRAVAFVRQANIANGPQQVNNGTPAGDVPQPAAIGQATGQTLSSQPENAYTLTREEMKPRAKRTKGARQ